MLKQQVQRSAANRWICTITGWLDPSDALVSFWSPSSVRGS
jgi:hypothetical protein